MALVGLGDSITDGFGASPGRSYFEQLKARLQPRVADNFARSTTTSLHCLEQQVPALPAYPSELYGVVVVTTGGNDLIHNYGNSPPRPDAMYGATAEQARPWVASFGLRLDSLLDSLPSKFPGGHRVFLATIYDPTDGQGDIEKAGLPQWPDGLAIHAAYNLAIRERSHRATIVDLHALFLGHGIHHGAQPYWYYANLEDPNDAGYEAITREFETATFDHVERARSGR